MNVRLRMQRVYDDKVHCMQGVRVQIPETNPGLLHTEHELTNTQPNTIDLSTRLLGIHVNPTNSVVNPKSLVPRYIVLGCI